MADTDRHERVRRPRRETSQVMKHDHLTPTADEFSENAASKALAKTSINQRPRRSGQVSQYDYSRKPGGNRMTRRAARFGSNTAGSSNKVTNMAAQAAMRPEGREKERAYLAKSRRSQRYTSKGMPEVREDDDRSESLSMELRGGYGGPPEPLKSRFTMGERRARENGVSRDQIRGSFGDQNFQDKSQSLGQHDVGAPLNVPYTTPASEFLYGTSVVVSALHASRRKLYRLYIYEGENRAAQNQDMRIRRLAVERGVVVERVKGDWLRVLDKMSGGRPHNGYILEASPLPKLPVTGFHQIEKRDGSFHVMLDHQSREDQEINGKDTRIRYDVAFPRYPFVLLLDGILDPGNLGAILRSAFFLGVDAVAIANRSSAPLSPVALKASSGASESIPLVSTSQPSNFLETCKSHGWKVYAAVAPGSDQSKLKKYLCTSDLKSPVRDHPCILILGSEGEGLRWNIQKMADYDIGIEGARAGQGNVDSLNVSVAAGLLCEAFLRKPSEKSLVAKGPSNMADTTQVHSESSRDDLLF